MKSESEHDVSFDPRSWVGPEAGGVGTPMPPQPTPRPAPTPAGDKARWALAAVASIVILLVGAGLARSHHAARPIPAPVATNAAG